jgi:uncharacterized protein (UPF0147 family)
MLTASEGEIAALRQRVRFATGRIEDVISALEDVTRDRGISQDTRDQINEQVLALKYTVDFTLGETR